MAYKKVRNAKIKKKKNTILKGKRTGDVSCATQNRFLFGSLYGFVYSFDTCLGDLRLLDEK